MKYNFILIIVLFLVFFKAVNAQSVPVHVSYTSIYRFIDELANEKVIEINTAVKPYSRTLILSKLLEASKKSDLLTKRQQEELDFYLQEFGLEQDIFYNPYTQKPKGNILKKSDQLNIGVNPLGLFYKDSLFTFSVKPIAGIQFWNNKHGSNYHYWNGAEIYAYIGKHLGIYASLRDNYEDKLLSNKTYLTTRPAARYKSGQYFSEMRGGITWSWNWGNIGLVKDHFEWGNYYHYPSIFSAKPPSITQFKLFLNPVKWFEFNYFHGWLVSGVVDSVRTYTFTNSYGTSNRTVYRKKFLAANLFTFKPFKNFYASIGNSIIYSDMDIHPAYLIPFFLYKSVDHTLNQNLSNEGGQNSQFFLDISSRQIKHLHLYTTLFFDDVSFKRFKENGHFDYYSFKAGVGISNLIPNLFFITEYFYSYPLVYKHDMPTTTFESNFYNLGHYLQDNSREIYLELAYCPVKGLQFKTWYNFAQHGPDYESLGTNRLEVVDLFLKTIEWENKTFGVYASYQFIPNAFVFTEIVNSNITGDVVKYTPPFYYGNTTTFSAGINYGF